MRHHSPTKRHHFLAHTIEHILGSLCVLSVAMYVGYVAYAETSSTTTSNASSGTVIGYLATPTLSVGSVGSGGIDLVWTMPGTLASGVGFEVFRGDLMVARVTTLAYKDTSGIAPGANYLYRVRAIDMTGNTSADSNQVTVSVPSGSTASSVDTVPPSAPSLSILSLTSSEVALAILPATDNVGVVSYKVFRNGAFLSSLAATDRFTDANSIVPGGTYYYAMKAMDAAGNESSFSATVTAMIPQQGGATQTTSTTASTSIVTTQPSPVASTPSPLEPVSFGVTVAPITDCAGGKAMTEVFFVTSDPEAGRFLISSDNGMKNAPLDWGRYPFPNGRYVWQATVKSGYAIEGAGSGNFLLSGECATTPAPASSTNSLSSPTATAATFPLKYPESSTVVPKISIDGVSVAAGDSISGLVTLSAVTKGSTRTVFVLESASGTKQFVDKQLGVVRKDGTDEWTVLWSTTNMDDGDYTLAALLDTSIGTTISKKVPFSVRNAAKNATLAALALKRPMLKLLVDNMPIVAGAQVRQGDEIELRVGATDAKKVDFYAIVPTGTSPIEISEGVIDDLLSGKSQDIWTGTWESGKTAAGAYKVFVRVLFLDGTVSESIPLSVTLVPSGAPIVRDPGGNPASATPLLSDDERKAIVLRVEVPGGCSTKDECAVFCSVPANKEACAAFARAAIEADLTKRSLLDGVSKEHAELVLSDPRKRSDIPDIVTDADELADYCSDPAHVDNCSRMLAKNDLATADDIAKRSEALSKGIAEEERLFASRVGTRIFTDSDEDGISDYDEVNIFHTDPLRTDTDDDHVPDGVEIFAHTNPRGSATLGASDSAVGERVDFENPLIAGAERTNLLSVENVSVAEVGLNTEGTSTAKKLFFSGKAIPNGYVTIYIFSTPIIVTVKADESGVWTYTLDRELSDGSHQAISAVTDEGGRILAKSTPLPFVKVAAAVSVGGNALLPEDATPGFFSGASLYAMIAILVGLIGVAFSIIGFVVHGKGKDDGPLFPEAKA